MPNQYSLRDPLPTQELTHAAIPVGPGKSGALCEAKTGPITVRPELITCPGCNDLVQRKSCGIANPGGVPCTKQKGHDKGHDLAAYGPTQEQAPERISLTRETLRREHGRLYVTPTEFESEDVLYVRADLVNQSCAAPTEVEAHSDVELLPWEQGVLADWDIVGMNHYHKDHQRWLFVAMTNGVHCIRAESTDADAVFGILAMAAQVHSASVSAPVGEVESVARLTYIDVGGWEVSGIAENFQGGEVVRKADYDSLRAVVVELRDALVDMVDLWKRAQPIIRPSNQLRNIELDSQVIAARAALTKVGEQAETKDLG